MINELLKQINKKNDMYMYVDWKTKSTTTEMFNNKKINFKTLKNIVNKRLLKLKDHIIITYFEIIKNNLKKPLEE